MSKRRDCFKPWCGVERLCVDCANATPKVALTASERALSLEQTLSLLISYGAIHTVTGVRYPDGTHEDAIKSAERLRDAIRASSTLEQTAREIALATIEEFAGCLLAPDGYTAEMFYAKRWTDIITKHFADPEKQAQV